MSDEITPLSKAEQALARATTPQQSKEVEAMAAAARAWANEQENYELVIDAFRIYFLARCKTTELIAPNIRQGGDHKSENWDQSDIDVTLINYGFTPKQFSRRKKELARRKLLDAYIDDCIINTAYPSIKGIVQFAVMPISHGMDAQAEFDRADELKDKWGVKPGQVWVLGKHRLVCGDSQDKNILSIATLGEVPDMIITDPPYGINLDTDYSKMPSTKPEGNKQYSAIINDDKPFDYGAVILRCKEEFWFGGDYYCKTLPDNGSWLVWDKRVEDKFDAMIGSAFELIWSKKNHKREIIRHNNTLFSGEVEARDKLHPTIKPTKVIEWIINRYAEPEALIADLYSGAGTMIISCENMDRRCIAIEIDPKYVAVTLERWQRATTINPILEINYGDH